MKRIAAFDFDGTITKKDTLLEFLKFTHGGRYYIYLLILSPMLLTFKLGLIKNYKAKQILFSFFYKGWNINKFNSFCENFTKTIEIRPKALNAIKKHIENKDQIVIISASMENWLCPWAKLHGINSVLATQIEVKEEKITGRFLSKNCYGTEKVNRLSRLLPIRTDYYLTAYGDSKGDKELLEYADEGYLKNF